MLNLLRNELIYHQCSVPPELMACAGYDAHMEDKWRARCCMIHNALDLPAAARVGFSQQKIESAGVLEQRATGKPSVLSREDGAQWQEKLRSAT